MKKSVAYIVVTMRGKSRCMLYILGLTKSHGEPRLRKTIMEMCGQEIVNKEGATMRKLVTAIGKLTMEIFSTLGSLLKILTWTKNSVNYTLKEEEIIVKKTFDIDDLAEALADLTIEVKVLEAKVQRLSEFRDTAGYVPISETGGKQ